VKVASQGSLARYARGVAIAFEFTGSIVGGAIAGWWIDRWLGTAPYAALGLTLLGTVVGFVRLLQMLQRFRSIDRQAG
jgi:ATP synthase protein I